MADYDAVDGSHPTASRCAKVVVVMNHRKMGAVHDPKRKSVTGCFLKPSSHRRLVPTIFVAKQGVEVLLLAQYHAKVHNREKRREQDEHPDVVIRDPCADVDNGYCNITRVA